MWELDAEVLLATGRPALLALIGQTRITQPERTLPTVIAALKTVADPEAQHRLVNTFVALVTDEELLVMIEKLIEDEDLLIDTAFQQRVRKAHAEGREEGREEGALDTLRHTIIDALRVRFQPSDAVLQPIDAALVGLHDEATLHTLFLAALQAESLAAFQADIQQYA